MVVMCIHASHSAQGCKFMLVWNCIKAIWKCYDAECHQPLWLHDTWNLSGSSSDHFLSLSVFHFLFGYVLGYIWVLHPDLNKQNSTVSLCSIYIYIYTVVLFQIMVKSSAKSGWRQWGHLIKIKARMLIIGVYLRIECITHTPPQSFILSSSLLCSSCMCMSFQTFVCFLAAFFFPYSLFF